MKSKNSGKHTTNSNKGKWLLAGIVGLLLILGGAYWYQQAHKDDNSSNNVILKDGKLSPKFKQIIVDSNPSIAKNSYFVKVVNTYLKAESYGDFPKMEAYTTGSYLSKLTSTPAAAQEVFKAQKLKDLASLGAYQVIKVYNPLITESKIIFDGLLKHEKVNADVEKIQKDFLVNNFTLIKVDGEWKISNISRYDSDVPENIFYAGLDH